MIRTELRLTYRKAWLCCAGIAGEGDPPKGEPGCERRNRLGGFCDATGSQAARADANVSGRPVHLDVHTAQIWALRAPGLDVGVTDVVGDAALLAANCAKGWHNFLSKGANL